MLFGYARVSTGDQNPDHQIDALLRAGVERDNVYLDRASGAKASRPQFDIVLRMLRLGDTLKVTRLDRLSRSVLHLVALAPSCAVQSHADRPHARGIDTDTMEGRAMFGMLSVLAELQRELIVANTKDGLAAASARGRVGGRRPRLTSEQAALAQQLYVARTKTVQQIADLFGVPRSMVYGHLTKDSVSVRPMRARVANPDSGMASERQGE
ncbi:recombinase family protein [Nonomuraea sp. KM90]|uniref:recombinase family protein n=1 Tax=Nonomuraea sp. KM90 TaxID=3457428 RepID=UPI003FCD3C51